MGSLVPNAEVASEINYWIIFNTRFNMRSSVMMLVLMACVSADKLPAKEHHGNHDLVASPHHTVPQTEQHHVAQHPSAYTAPIPQDPYAPSHHENDQGYYYYYYPVEEKPKEKDFFSKMMDKLYINKMMDKLSEFYYQTARSDIIVPGATTFMIGATGAAVAMILGPPIGRLISDFIPFNFNVMRSAVSDFIDRTFNVSVVSRDIEFTFDDVILYVERVLEAINKEY